MLYVIALNPAISKTYSLIASGTEILSVAGPEL